MVDFQRPDILDPDLIPSRGPSEEARSAQDLAAGSKSLEDRYRALCEYGRLLWEELAEARRYLRDEVAGSDGIVTGRPAMLPDLQSWQRWAAVYERMCAALGGTHGDNGYGRSEATLIARTHGIEIR